MNITLPIQTNIQQTPVLNILNQNAEFYIIQSQKNKMTKMS